MVDTLIPALAGGSENHLMGRKHYSAEFMASAVALYRDTEGATIADIARDLGCSKTALNKWINDAGVATRGPRGSRSRPATSDPAKVETPAEELARLRAEVRALSADKRKLETERDILRSAAKYFAGETRW
jgi:transposase